MQEYYKIKNIYERDHETKKKIEGKYTYETLEFLKDNIWEFTEKVPKLNTETIKAIEDAEKGIGLSKGYTNLDEMWEDLEKED